MEVARGGTHTAAANGVMSYEMAGKLTQEGLADQIKRINSRKWILPKWPYLMRRNANEGGKES